MSMRERKRFESYQKATCCFCDRDDEWCLRFYDFEEADYDGDAICVYCLSGALNELLMESVKDACNDE